MTKDNRLFSNFQEPTSRESIKFFKKHLDIYARHRNFRNFGGRGRLKSNPFVNYFVKTGLDENHKIVIPAQHWFGAHIYHVMLIKVNKLSPLLW
jgi:hypothetical protein